MNSGTFVVGAATFVWLVSCSPEVPVQAAEADAAIDAPTATAGSVTGELADVSAGDAQAAARSGATALAPGSLQEFLARINPADAAFTRDDFARVFRRRDDAGTEPEATYAFADLDGDGREEAYAAIGDGWWGKHHRVLQFDPAGDRWQLACDSHVHVGTRGAPVVSVLTGEDGPRLQVSYVSGWGTGITCSTARVLERREARLHEVLTVEVRREEICGANGPVLEVGLEPLTFVREANTGAVLATTRAHVAYYTGELGNLPQSLEYELPLRWRRTAADGAFEPAELLWVLQVVRTESDFYWRHAASTWIERNGEAAMAFAATTNPAQAAILRRTCEFAAQSWASAAQTALAERLRALLPPEPPR